MLIKKPRIAILTLRNTYTYGGVLSSLKVAYEFTSTYFQPTVFFLGFGPDVAMRLKKLKFSSTAKTLSYFGMNCVEIGARWGFWEPGHYWFTRSTWKKYLKDFDYVFVVSGTCIAAHPAQLLNKKYVMWIATSYQEDRAERVKKLRGVHALINYCATGVMNKLEHTILNQASYIWAYSAYAEKDFTSKLNNKKDIMSRCGYPIDSSTHQVLDGQKEEAIIAVGRFSDPRKNIGMLLRVFQQLYERNNNLVLYIVGMKPDAETLFPFIDFSSFKNIVFTGQVSTADLHHFYQRCQLMLITSYQEGLGIVGLEAMYYGLPVVSTDCGGTADYVINGTTGYLVPINDDSAMADHAHTILSNAYHSQALSFNAKQLIAEQFSKKTIYARFKKGLITAYPELAEHFESIDQLSEPYEHRNNRPHIHSTHQP
jgi:glycosyltransferase involved in cell wall biosynthesis